MLKRVAISVLFALVVCAVTFYLAYFVGLIYSAATGPLNPANAPQLQAALRHIAVPISVGLAVLAFVLALRRSGRRAAGRKLAQVISIRDN